MPTDAVWALEIVPHDQTNDPYARALQQVLHDLGSHPAITHGRLYLFQGSHSSQFEQAARNLCLDPIVADARLNLDLESVGIPGSPKEQIEASRNWIVEVLPHPGVTDAEGDSLTEALTRDGFVSVRSRAGHRYHLAGVDASTVAAAARLIAHDVVESVTWRQASCPIDVAWWNGAFMPEAAPDPTVETIQVRGLGARALRQLSADRLLALPVQDLEAIRDYFATLDRDPSDVELEMIAQTWSEHCAHRTFKATIRHREPDAGVDVEIPGLLRTYIMAATEQVNRPWVLSAFRDNAGVIAFDRQREISFKVETHNHPSAIEPFGGANTGVGGVVRDVLGVSAEPIANTDVLCFGTLDAEPGLVPPGTMAPRRIYDGVVAGIADYGNKMGIPTVNGATLFDQGYVANPLVFCGTVGLAPRGRRPTEPHAGDLIVVAGGRAGRDGIHGATFSSDVLGDTHAELGSVVQIGDPIVEKRLADALPRARDLGLYSAITDCGAGGLSSAVGEMASELGADVELSRVPLKYDGLRPWEIWLSEAQERMVLAVPPEKWLKLQEIFAAEGVEATAIGRFSGEGRLCVRYGGAIVADLDNAFLHGGMPLRRLDSIWYGPTNAGRPGDIATADLGQLLERALSDMNVASKESIVRRYDHEVQGRTVGKPFVGPEDIGPADAAVLRPETRSWRGVAIGCGINPWYGELDPYAMALLTVDEALRNVVAVGADPARTALLDNFCWGNPALADRLGGLVRATQGCHDAAVAFRAPFISGKDSLNNEYRVSDDLTQPIPGTLLISAIGIVPDVRRATSMFLKQPGNLVYLVGVTGDDLGGSLALRLDGGRGGQAPSIRLERSRRIMGSVYRSVRAGLVQACHDISEGGLAVAAAEMAIASGCGLEIDLDRMPVDSPDLPEGTRLFAESPTRFLIEVSQDDSAAFEKFMKRVPFARLGQVLSSPRLRFLRNEKPIVDAHLDRLRASWQAPLLEVVA